MATKKVKTEGKQVDKALQEARLAELATKINEGHSQCVAAIRTSLERAREIGVALQEAKEVCKQQLRVNFTVWLKGNSRVSECQSQRYMKIAKNWKEVQKWMNSEKDGQLTLTEALKHLSPKAKGNKKESDKSPPVKLTIASDKVRDLEANARSVEFKKGSSLDAFVKKHVEQFAEEILRLVSKAKDLKDQDDKTLDKELAAIAVLKHVQCALQPELLLDKQPVA